jgi:hypothetical protein
MATELPFPISFEVPAGWTLVAPELSGHPEAAYVAVRNANASEPIATSFVVNGFASHDQSINVAALADSYLADLRSRYPVLVLKRDVMTAGAATESAQLLQVEYPLGNKTLTLNQIQIINAVPGSQDVAATAVLQLLMTCPAELFEQAGPEFTRFVGTIEPLATESGVR